MLKAFFLQKKSKKPIKPMTLMIIGLSIVLGGLILFNITKSVLISQFFKNYTPPAVSVASVTVNQGHWQPNLNTVASFVAVNGVDINSEAAGNVVDVHFTSGENVAKNAALIDIDDRTDKATLKFNQADLVLQTVNYKRQVQLMKKNATSQSEVDAAKAQMLEAEAKVEKTTVNIKQKHITTPFAGRLGIRLINLGEYITPGQTNIVTLQSLDPLFLEFYSPEQLLPKIHVNQRLLFSIEPNTEKLFSGSITAINAKADTETHNVKIQATLSNCPAEVFNNKMPVSLVQTQKIPNTTRTKITCSTEKNQAANITNYAFIPGMFASVEIEQPSIPNALTLPTTAISYSLYGNSVFLILPKKDKNNQDILAVKRVFVTTGDEQGNQVMITQGLEAGQHVVSAGEVKLQDNTRVVINNDVPLNTSRNTPPLGE